MSHSPGIGQDGQEATNGVDSSDSPETADWTDAENSTTQALKFQEGEACLERDDKLETVSDFQRHAVQNPDAVFRKTRTNSAPHANTHTSGESPPYADESLVECAAHSQPTYIDCSDMDRGIPPHTQVSDGREVVDGNQYKQQNERNDEAVKNIEDHQITAHISKQPLTENSTEEQITPPDQAPPLVPAPPANSTPPPALPEPDDWPCPTHVMAEVRVRSAPERDRERVVRGMQDSKSLDGISEACGGGSRGTGARGGQAEGRRATISSALELEGTVSRDGDLTHFITKNLEQKIKMSSRPSLDTDSDSSGPVVRGRGSLRRPADIPPIDPSVLLDLHKHTQEVAHSVEMMLRSLNGTIQNMTALSVGYIQTYRDSVDSLGESVDMSIKGMYTLMARCEELDRSMQPIQTLAAQIRDIKRTLDALEGICK